MCHCIQQTKTFPTEPFFCAYLCLLSKASDLSDIAKTPEEQLVLALELSLFCVCNSRQALRICIHSQQI